MKKIIIITGQTATGKTSLAVKKAIEENGELINADSRQIYKHLNIITGKDIPKGSTFHEVKKKDGFSVGYYSLPMPTCHSERSEESPANAGFSDKPRDPSALPQDDSIKLWLYDIVDPKQYFSSYDFESLALPLIKKILDQGKTPIIIGGTYFYLYHLLYGVETNVPPDWNLRKKLDDKTVPEMQKMLKKLNPTLYKSLNNSDKNNPRRLMRKIEICLYDRHSGKRGNERIQNRFWASQNDVLLSQKLGMKDLQIEYIGLCFKNKTTLHANIKKRVEERLKNGAIDEVKNLLKMGYTDKDPGLKTIGCKEIIKFLKIQHLTSNIRYQLSTEWQIHEHQYAKKQNTFMKKDKNIKWIKV